MKEEKIIDITGTPLKPSEQGKDCPGNGKNPLYECCCDECDYFLVCFTPKEEVKNNAEINS